MGFLAGHMRVSLPVQVIRVYGRRSLASMDEGPCQGWDRLGTESSKPYFLYPTANRAGFP